MESYHANLGGGWRGARYKFVPTWPFQSSEASQIPPKIATLWASGLIFVYLTNHDGAETTRLLDFVAKISFFASGNDIN